MLLLLLLMSNFNFVCVSQMTGPERDRYLKNRSNWAFKAQLDAWFSYREEKKKRDRMAAQKKRQETPEAMRRNEEGVRKLSESGMCRQITIHVSIVTIASNELSHFVLFNVCLCTAVNIHQTW